MNNDFDIEEQSEWLGSLRVRPFDANGVVLASKIARELRKRSGAVVSLSSKNAVAELGRAVLELNDKDLNYLFRVLLDSVTAQDSVLTSPSKKKRRLRKNQRSNSKKVA